MKIFKNKNLFIAGFMFLFNAVFLSTVFASNAYLYVSPSNLNKTIDDIFDLSIMVNPSSNKVCAIEGTLIFNNLSCQNIVPSKDVIFQSTPTCLNPYFLLGIPNCATTDKALFTVSVKAKNVGNSYINFKDIDIIGEGKSISSDSAPNNYTIISKSTSQQKQTLEEKQIQKPTPIKQAPKLVQETTTQKTNLTNSEQLKKVSINNYNIEKPNYLIASIIRIMTFNTGSNIVFGIVLFIILFVIYIFIKNKNKKNKIN